VNWDHAKLDPSGDGDFTDAGETDYAWTHNVVNEITARGTDSNGTADYTLTHDAVGNMTEDGMNCKFVHAVWSGGSHNTPT